MRFAMKMSGLSKPLASGHDTNDSVPQPLVELVRMAVPIYYNGEGHDGSQALPAIVVDLRVNHDPGPQRDHSLSLPIIEASVQRLESFVSRLVSASSGGGSCCSSRSRFLRCCAEEL